ncbi:protein of unknown function [Bartonella clarridgeiae 73]|uniref:Uncharacterized protein n=1 Tax=Bartonella clarridgeiae (strain CCUG 45776 / CIP 104772 / 73) TaxID=696125 RepID=E6YJH4_BARC7|nr:protein of unknown function [Bartonella clarridgeiae 73]
MILMDKLCCEFFQQYNLSSIINNFAYFTIFTIYRFITYSRADLSSTIYL